MRYAIVRVLKPSPSPPHEMRVVSETRFNRFSFDMAEKLYARLCQRAEEGVEITIEYTNGETP